MSVRQESDEFLKDLNISITNILPKFLHILHIFALCINFSHICTICTHLQRKADKSLCCSGHSSYNWYSYYKLDRVGPVDNKPCAD